MNSIYGPMFLPKEAGKNEGIALFELIGETNNGELRRVIKKGAAKKGLTPP